MSSSWPVVLNTRLLIIMECQATLNFLLLSKPVFHKKKNRHSSLICKMKISITPNWIIFDQSEVCGINYITHLIHAKCKSPILMSRDGILRERRRHARRKYLADCRRIIGSPHISVGSIEEMRKKCSKWFTLWIVIVKSKDNFVEFA